VGACTVKVGGDKTSSALETRFGCSNIVVQIKWHGILPRPVDASAWSHCQRTRRSENTIDIGDRQGCITPHTPCCSSCCCYHIDSGVDEAEADLLVRHACQLQGHRRRSTSATAVATTRAAGDIPDAGCAHRYPLCRLPNQSTRQAKHTRRDRAAAAAAEPHEHKRTLTLTADGLSLLP
jgi:hypothetical protein